MADTQSTARSIAEELVDRGQCVITRSDARSKVKERGMETPWEKKITAGFESAGWESDGDVFYDPSEVSERTIEISGNLRSESRVVVSRSIVRRDVADMERLSGEWVEIIEKTMRDEGWNVDEENGLYYLPATELVTESSLGYYLMNSFSIADRPDS